MALTTKTGTLAGGILEQFAQLINKTGEFIPIGNIAAALNTDVADLVEKFTDPKVSTLGTIILDHVTFYTDAITINKTVGSASRVKGNVKILKDKIKDLAASETYIIDNKKREYEAIKQIFGDGGEDFYSITLENVLITVNRPRNIIRTQVKGDDFTIKEFISNGDYSITFNGILAGSNQYQTATKDIAKLNALFALSDSIKVNSIYLNNIFGITDIVIVDSTFNQRSDYGNLTDFSIIAESDIVNYNIAEEIDLII